MIKIDTCPTEKASREPFDSYSERARLHAHAHAHTHTHTHKHTHTHACVTYRGGGGGVGGGGAYTHARTRSSLPPTHTRKHAGTRAFMLSHFFQMTHTINTSPVRNILYPDKTFSYPQKHKKNIAARFGEKPCFWRRLAMVNRRCCVECGNNTIAGSYLSTSHSTRNHK